MLNLRIFNVGNKSFNAIREIKMFTIVLLLLHHVYQIRLNLAFSAKTK